MKNIQLALHDSEYTQSLRNLLVHDGAHRVYVVDQPDLRLDGVVVIDGNINDDLSFLDPEPERFVVITRKGSDRLARIWEAGVRHVVFEGDSPSTAHLAIIAAELRLPRQDSKVGRSSGTAPCREGHHAPLRSGLPILDPPARCGRCKCPSRQPLNCEGI
jgi:hypothetical protein